MSVKIEVLDTTLRDGMQGRGINFSYEDKIQAIRLFSDLGIDLIEAGTPASNEVDRNLFSSACTANIAAFGATRRKDARVQDDESLRALALAQCDTVVVFGKCSNYHVKQILKCTESDNLEMIISSVAYLKSIKSRVIFDAEHFFYGYSENKAYALETLRRAHEAGADTLVLCDTDGGALPETIAAATREAVALFPNAVIGIHCHNDSGLAVAGSMAAIAAGARHVQGTLLGMGERCGNACLSTLIPNLMLKADYTLIPKENLSGLTAAARHLAVIANIALPTQLPYVGDNAFAHKAGMHCDGVLKDAHTFEHVCPESVGNGRSFAVSLLSGKASISEKMRELMPQAKWDSTELYALIAGLKDAEAQGFTYDGAEASFFLLCKRLMKSHVNFFELIHYKVITDQTGYNSAVVKIRVGEREQLSCGEGKGPVHALDLALRSALSAFYPALQNVELTDYKVRVLDSESATGAKVRVLVTSGDGEQSWTTVGVSADIIQASFEALTDSLNYYLTIKKER